MVVDPLRGAGDPQRRVAGMQAGELFEEHGRMVYGLCRALLRDPDDADDATQATFISAYTSLLGGNEVREPAAWLAAIARNECSARARARMREPLPLIDADIGHVQGPEAELDRQVIVEELQQAISELPEKQREAVVLRDLYGLRYTEVSVALGMSVASVESLLFRARRSLRVSLKPLASGALVVPVAVREGIASAFPGLLASGGAGGGAASGAVGLGLLAKFAGGPVALKIAVGVVAVTATGSVAIVEVEQSGRQAQTTVAAPAHPPSAGKSLGTRGGSPQGSGSLVPIVDTQPARNHDDGGAGRGNERVRGAGAPAGADDGRPEGTADDGARGEGGPSSTRSGGAETESHSRRGDAKSDVARSHGSGASGDGNTAEGRDDVREVEGTHSASGNNHALSEGEDGAGVEGSRESPDGSGSEAHSGSDAEAGGASPEGTGSEQPDPPDDESPVTPPPPT